MKVNLFMNDDAAELATREVALETGVFLRNQNRAPDRACSRPRPPACATCC